MTALSARKWTPGLGAEYRLIGIVLAFVVGNAAGFWFIEEWDEFPEWLAIVLLGAWIFQSLLLALWAALAPGALAVRFCTVLPLLIVAVLFPTLYESQPPVGFDLLVLIAGGAAMLAVSTMCLIVMGKLLGIRIDNGSTPDETVVRLRFNLKQLILLMTFWSVALSMIFARGFRPSDPQPLFGPMFAVNIVLYGSLTSLALLLPVIAIPLFTLSSRVTSRGVGWAVGCWLALTVVATGVWTLLEGAMWPEGVVTFFLLQLGAGILGAITGWLLRLAGLQIQYRSDNAVTMDG